MKISSYLMMPVVASALALTACGGGGSNGGSTPPAPASFTINSSVNIGGTIDILGDTIFTDGDSAAYTITSDIGYSLNNISGTCTGTLAGNTYTITSVAQDCSLTANFTINNYAVSGSVNSGGVPNIGGTITPAATTADYGTTATFTVTPDIGYTFSNLGASTCPGGTWNGQSYTTGPITATCSVEAEFILNEYFIDPIAITAGGIIDGPIPVFHGETASLNVQPDLGYSVSSVTGCGGTLNGLTYTTAPMTADCVIEASFAIDTFTVSTTAGLNGSITPASTVVDYNTSTAFTITPDTGYHVATATGCNGTYDAVAGNYNTGAVTADCVVDATFAINTYTVSATAAAGGSITPASTTLDHGTTLDFTITPDAGFGIGAITTNCTSGSLIGNVYTTGAIAGDCSIDVGFNGYVGNNAPVSDAGLAQFVEAGTLVTLDGSLSNDPNSDPINYSWSIISAPATSTVTTVTDNTLVNPSFTPDVDGDYVIALTVNDGALDSAESIVTVKAMVTGLVMTSADTFPIAIDAVTPNITSTINVAAGPASISYVRVYLDITHTWDADLNVSLTSPIGTVINLTLANGGSGDNYSGTIFDDYYASQSITTGIAPFTGIYSPQAPLTGFNTEDANGTWTLTVDDTFASGDHGTLNSWQIVFPDAIPQLAPVANAGLDQSLAAGTAITLDGSASSDANGDTLSYSWQLTQKPAGSTAVLDNAAIVNPTFVADLPGIYTAELVVNDGIADSVISIVSISAASVYDAAIATNYISTDTPLAIPDSDTVTGVTSSIAVSADVTNLSGVTVALDITHTWDSDLDIYLVSPAGTMIELSTDNGGSSPNYTGTVFYDLAATSITSGFAPLTGEFSPEQPLTTLFGEDSNGTWQLIIYDDAAGDTGTIDSWQLNVW